MSETILSAGVYGVIVLAAGLIASVIVIGLLMRYVEGRERD